MRADMGVCNCDALGRNRYKLRTAGARVHANRRLLVQSDILIPLRMAAARIHGDLPASVRQDEIGYRTRGRQTVRMVPDSGLRNDRNIAAECFEPLLKQQDVFLRR